MMSDYRNIGIDSAIGNFMEMSPDMVDEDRAFPELVGDVCDNDTILSHRQMS